MLSLKTMLFFVVTVKRINITALRDASNTLLQAVTLKHLVFCIYDSKAFYSVRYHHHFKGPRYNLLHAVKFWHLVFCIYDSNAFYSVSSSIQRTTFHHNLQCPYIRGAKLKYMPGPNKPNQESILCRQWKQVYSNYYNITIIILRSHIIEYRTER